MPKPNRIVIPGLPHHVTQRGNNHQTVFNDDFDRRQYLTILKERCEMYKVEVLGYCLMGNHVHLVVIPQKVDSLSQAIGYSHRLYSQRFNGRHNRSGHLWESRFYSCPLDDAHFIRALVYVDRNPVRAGLVANAADYAWSSARGHLELSENDVLIDTVRWRKIAENCDWADLIRQEEKEEILSELRNHTFSGKPFNGPVGTAGSSYFPKTER